MMSRLAVEEIAARNPAAVVVKGDLTADGRPEEYAAFLRLLRHCLGDRLTHVRGNHDCYRNQDYASEPVQVVPGPRGAGGPPRHVPSRPHQRDASCGPARAARRVGQRADPPGPSSSATIPSGTPATSRAAMTSSALLPDPTDALLHVFERRRRLVTYAAGHTHRNHVVEVAGVPSSTSGRSRTSPGRGASTRSSTQGSSRWCTGSPHPEGLRWAERTRAMYLGAYGEYAYGSLEERCRLLPSRGG